MNNLVYKKGKKKPVKIFKHSDGSKMIRTATGAVISLQMLKLIGSYT